MDDVPTYFKNLRRFLDNEPLNPEEISKYSNLVTSAMESAKSQIGSKPSTWNNRGNHPSVSESSVVKSVSQKPLQCIFNDTNNRSP